MSKNIVILGSTGSIGRNAVKVARHLSDRISVYGIAAGWNTIDLLAEQAVALNCKKVVTAAEEKLDHLQKLLPDPTIAAAGDEELIKLVTAPEVDLVLCAIVGTGGLLPVLSAIRAGKDIALASKEVLVMAGEIVMAEAARYGVRILPVDSEHSAIFQCLEGRLKSNVSRLVLTASGGAFRDASNEEINNATYEQALTHPTWNMGPKVTIDSASLMNKALEIIEARFLFDMPGDAIDVVIHPQAVIHSMVEFVDGTILAQMSTPDMRFPIQYAMTYPEKVPGSLQPLDFRRFSELTFQPPDRKRFPALDFAYEALRQGGTLPAVLNAANEVAVEMFSQGRIKFPVIWNIIEKVMSLHQTVKGPKLEDILKADEWARNKAGNIL